MIYAEMFQTLQGIEKHLEDILIKIKSANSFVEFNCLLSGYKIKFYTVKQNYIDKGTV